MTQRGGRRLCGSRRWRTCACRWLRRNKSGSRPWCRQRAQEHLITGCTRTTQAVQRGTTQYLVFRRLGGSDSFGTALGRCRGRRYLPAPKPATHTPTRYHAGTPRDGRAGNHKPAPTATVESYVPSLMERPVTAASALGVIPPVAAMRPACVAECGRDTMPPRVRPPLGMPAAESAAGEMSGIPLAVPGTMRRGAPDDVSVRITCENMAFAAFAMWYTQYGLTLVSTACAQEEGGGGYIW